MTDSNTHASRAASAGSSDQQRAAYDREPVGICRGDSDGLLLIDGLAGRASLFGFGYEPIVNAISQGARQYVGDASAFSEQTVGADFLTPYFQRLCGDKHAPDQVLLCTSSDMTVDAMIRLARTHSDSSKFKTIALIGSDHGRSGMCRTASGQPELRVGFGPMMAGFVHVRANDLDALREAIDEQTACVLVSPIELRSAARPLEADYLRGIRSLCDDQGILLAVDETQIPFGSSGKPLSLMSIADLRADLVGLSAGLFGGLPGGLVLANGEIAEHLALPACPCGLPAQVAGRTLAEMADRNLPDSASDGMQDFAVMLAEQVGAFEFVRDVHATGMTIGVEMDIESDLFLSAADRVGLRVAQAGTTSFLMQLPLTISDADRDLLLQGITSAMTAVVRMTAAASEDLVSAEPDSVETGT